MSDWDANFHAMLEAARRVPIALVTRAMLEAGPAALPTPKRELIWPYEYSGTLEQWRQWCAERNDPATLAEVEATRPECPGPNCVLCNGEACAKCGAGLLTRFGTPPCEHDVMERHEGLRT